MIRKQGAVLGLAALLALGALEAHAQNGPITSRLTTARFILMRGWWGNDHDATTPTTFPYIANLAKSKGVQIDTVTLGTLINGNQATPGPTTAAGLVALSDTGLAKYDVILWYNVYRMYHVMDAATRGRIEAWYNDKNRGLACFHQCVRAADNGALEQGLTWEWWHDMMGRPYTIFAGQGNGPVYIDTEAAGDIYGGVHAPGDSFTINDEFYNYAGPVRGTTGSKIQLRTKKSRLPSNWNIPTREDNEDMAIAWIRDYRGGRFVLNGLFHTNQITNATGALRGFFDSTLVGTMRYLAGYDGCKDSNYVEYNPKATHQAPNACVTPVFLQVGKTGDVSGRVRLDDFKVAFTQPGAHSVEIFTATGAKVASHRGHGTREYRFNSIREPGVYYVRVMTEGMKAPYNRRIVLL